MICAYLTNESDLSGFIFYTAGMIVFISSLIIGAVNGKHAQIMTGIIFIISGMLITTDPVMVWIFIGSFLLLLSLSRWRTEDRLSLFWAIGLSTGLVVIPIEIIWQTGTLSFFYATGFTAMVLLNGFNPGRKHGMIFAWNLIFGIIMFILAFTYTMALVPLSVNIIICIMYVHSRLSHKGGLHTA